VSLKGGLGSASATCDGFTVGAVAAVNAAGSAIVGNGPWFWAAPFEERAELGGWGFPAPLPAGALAPVTKGSPQASTTLGVVATDATLTKAEAKRLAVMAQVGLARALYPIHTPLDGVVFAVATARKTTPAPLIGLAALGTIAANCLARAVARGVYAATALPFAGALPAWHDRFAPKAPGEQPS
jgi:L-aminopeptidase/D-esterase-like protein